VAPSTAAGSTTTVINLGSTITGADAYKDGLLVVDGLRRNIVSNTTTSVTVYPPLVPPPAAGRPTNISYGCNKTAQVTAGCGRFNNRTRFGGLPNMPRPETSQ
jgi:hypothetical protein